MIGGIDVRVLKLVSGEEVIGRFVGEDDKTITIERTLAMILQTNERGEISMFTAPFVMAAGDGRVQVNKSIIVGVPLDVDQKLISDYLQKTSPIAFT